MGQTDSSGRHQVTLLQDERAPARGDVRQRPRPQRPAALSGYGDMAGFPPTILNTGARDLMLSNTLLVHRKLRRAGVVADLHVHEGQAHGGWYRDYTAPETKETFEEIALFFDKHLEK